MKVTLNWLKEYVEFDLLPEVLAHRLTMAGLEVDAMEKLGDGLDSVIVARLDDVRPHPDADRLTLCTVATGSGIEQVVCGATNHRAGDLVALAQVGTELPGGLKIKKSKIRGQESCGMLCSLTELGLAASSEGILILPPGLELGVPVFAALGLKDVRFELGLTPNRPDCLSVVGVAREVCAMAGSPLKLPQPALAESGPPAAGRTSVTIEDADLCPRYAARLIEGVRIGPSPEWMVRRLETVGMRSINNVVDVTNFVMMELGHPLHAFDFSYLRGRRIVVRRARDGDRFVTLDGQERLLAGSDLVICDGEGPVALAGIMGGENSEVRPETVDILLESAYFNPSAIRRTSKRLGLHTESSHRFERGADVEMVPLALDRAAALIVELAGGQIAAGMVDAYPATLPKRQLTISAQRTSKLLGMDVDAGEIHKVLNSIGLTCDFILDRRDGALTVDVPHFRPDIEREIDLIEEVARLLGYDRIPVTMPVSSLSSQPLPRHLQLERRLCDEMASLGFAEVVNYSFVSAGSVERLGLAADDPRRRTVQLLNPLTEEQAVMRTTLVPSLLDTAARNIAYRTEDLALFELRPVFQPVPGEELPRESLRLTALLSGRREPLGWAQQSAGCDFFDIKGTVEELLECLNIGDVRWPSEHGESFYHPGKSCAVEAGSVRLGTLGEIHPEVQRVFDLPQPVYLLDLDAEALFAAAGKHRSFRPLSRYPDVERDSAFLIDEAVSAQQVLDTLSQVRLKDLESIVLFDVYRGTSLPPGKKSLAIRARYRALDRTLTDEIVQGLHGKLVQALQKSLGAELR
ncbi:MAG: phenylalanine--tRNA ligase subunit beta [Deltaproteobacteria bacterium]|nr:MAG: phenylalanine--tRNA ligase subunit beta [Deltaproteobacteria bacterium]